MSFVSMFKNPIGIGKAFSFLGSLGGFFSFASPIDSWVDAIREFEISSTVEGRDWKTGLVTPAFDSRWLGGVFEKPTSYSYGYVARVKGTDFFEAKNASRRIKRNLGANKQQEAEGKLTLIEAINGQQKAETEGKRSLTPKKFLLIGSNKLTGNIELSGLVSLIQFQHKGIKARCSKTEGEGAILQGLCDKEIFKPHADFTNAPGFIKQELKNEKGEQSVSLMKLKLEGKGLGVVWGQNKSSSAIKWSRTGYLYLKEAKKDTNNVVRKVWTAVGSRGERGFFVVHDLIFSKNGMGGKWMDRATKHGNIFVEGVRRNTHGQCSRQTNKDIRCLKSVEQQKVIDIPLSTDRNYYIWDPSRTKIKNGKLITNEEIELPFNLSFNSTWTSALTK